MTGFDTLGAGVLKVQSLTDGSCNGDAEAHVIHDSREVCSLYHQL